MVREHLSAMTIEGGRSLLGLTDKLGMQAQGAMWLLNHELNDWRFYLVTSLLDTLGRRKTYKNITEIMYFAQIGPGITADDVHLGSPNDNIFQMISQALRVMGGGVTIDRCNINGVLVDGFIYRSVISFPSEPEAKKIEKVFVKKTKDFIASKSKGVDIPLSHFISN